MFSFFKSQNWQVLHVTALLKTHGTHGTIVEYKWQKCTFNVLFIWLMCLYKCWCLLVQVNIHNIILTLTWQGAHLLTRANFSSILLSNSLQMDKSTGPLAKRGRKKTSHGCLFTPERLKTSTCSSVCLTLTSASIPPDTPNPLQQLCAAFLQQIAWKMPEIVLIVLVQRGLKLVLIKSH